MSRTTSGPRIRQCTITAGHNRKFYGGLAASENRKFYGGLAAGENRKFYRGLAAITAAGSICWASFAWLSVLENGSSDGNALFGAITVDDDYPRRLPVLRSAIRSVGAEALLASAWATSGSDDAVSKSRAAFSILS